MSVVIGVSSGKWVLMMLKSSSRETRLNMFLRSMKSADLVGRVLLDCGVMM